MKKERLQKIKTILYTIIKSRIQVVPTAHAIMCIYKIKKPIGNCSIRLGL